MAIMSHSDFILGMTLQSEMGKNLKLSAPNADIEKEGVWNFVRNAELNWFILRAAHYALIADIQNVIAKNVISINFKNLKGAAHFLFLEILWRGSFLFLWEGRYGYKNLPDELGKV